jgi:hypothetical protein
LRYWLRGDVYRRRTLRGIYPCRRLFLIWLVWIRGFDIVRRSLFLFLLGQSRLYLSPPPTFLQIHRAKIRIYMLCGGIPFCEERHIGQRDFLGVRLLAC